MQIAVLNETRDGESRVALVPESIKKLIALNVTVAVENRAGASAGASDADYKAAGARLTDDRAALLATAESVKKNVEPHPTPSDSTQIRPPCRATIV